MINTFEVQERDLEEVSLWKVINKVKKELTLHCVTMIDPETCWFEMKQIPDKRADTIANLVEQTWLSRYPWQT